MGKKTRILTLLLFFFSVRIQSSFAVITETTTTATTATTATDTGVAGAIPSANSSVDIPCDLSEIKKMNSGTLPGLYLSGEIHNNFYCSVDYLVHLNLANEGKIDLALEGSFSGNLSNDIRKFFDDPLTHALGTVFNIDRKFRLNTLEKKSNSEVFVHFVKTLRSNPILNTEWFKFRNDQTLKMDKELEESSIYSIIDQCADLKNREFSKALKTLSSSQLIQDDYANENLFLKFLGSFIKSYNSDYRFTYHPAIKMEEIRLVDFFYSWSYDFIKKFIVDLRNEFMAENIAKIYCDSASQHKPLLVVVGLSHIPGLILALNKKFGEEAPFKYRYSRESCKSLFETSSEKEALDIIHNKYPAFSRNEDSEAEFIETVEGIAQELQIKCAKNELKYFTEPLNEIPSQDQLKITRPDQRRTNNACECHEGRLIDSYCNIM